MCFQERNPDCDACVSVCMMTLVFIQMTTDCVSVRCELLIVCFASEHEKRKHGGLDDSNRYV